MTEAEALADEVRRLEAEEVASSTRAERAAEAVGGNAPVTASAQPAPAAKPDTKAVMAALLEMPAEKFTPTLILALDLGVRRLAEWRGGEEARERYALRPDERELLAQVWTPVVAHYLAQLEVSPLVAAVGVTGFVYGMKALPEGGLEAVLAGNGSSPVPRAEVPGPATSQLLQSPPTTQGDPVLELARQQAEELKRQRDAQPAEARA